MDVIVDVLAFVFAVSLVVFSVWFNMQRAKKNGGCGCCGGKCKCGHGCKCKDK